MSAPTGSARAFSLATVLSPREHWTTLTEAKNFLQQHRELLFELTKREIRDRYAGQALGTLWSVAHPLFLVTTYVVVFSFVFRVRFPEGGELPRDYASYILAGVMPWLTFSESMARSCTSIISNRSLVKQVVFPIELLPIRSVLAAFITMLITLTALLVYSLLRFGSIPATFPLVIPLMFFQLLAMSGVGLFLAGLGSYFRDTKDVIQVVALVGPYFIPAFFLPAWLPAALKPVIYANPFSYMVWCFQDACFYGAIEHPIAWLVFPLLSVFVFSLGFMSFRRLKFAFGNFL